MALNAYDDWRENQHPASMGRAPWLTGPFVEAIRVCRSARNEQSAILTDRARRRRADG